MKYIRQLKAKNIAVFFEKENINTLNVKGEVCLTIMASLAQQESQSLSQNVRLGLQYRYQQGKAEIVRRIYTEYLEGSIYCDALLQKTVTTDFLNKKRVKNKGLVPQYYVENNHEAIIQHHIYMLIQEEILRRARLDT